MADFKLKPKRPAEIIINTTAPVRNPRAKIEESIVGYTECGVDVIVTYDIQVNKPLSLPVMVRTMIARHNKVKLNPIVPECLLGFVILIETPTEILKLPRTIETPI